MKIYFVEESNKYKLNNDVYAKTIEGHYISLMKKKRNKSFNHKKVCPHHQAFEYNNYIGFTYLCNILKQMWKIVGTLQILNLKMISIVSTSILIFIVILF